jgi:hypothetical protein
MTAKDWMEVGVGSAVGAIGTWVMIALLFGAWG